MVWSGGLLVSWNLAGPQVRASFGYSVKQIGCRFITWTVSQIRNLSVEYWALMGASFLIRRHSVLYIRCQLGVS